MAYEGTGPLWPTTSAGESAGNHKLSTSGPSNGNDGTVSFSTDTTVRYILVNPGVTAATTPNQTTDPSGIAAQGKGYEVLKADMNAAANLPAQRHVEAGTWTAKTRITVDNADVGAPNNTWQVVANVYRRSSAGAYTFLFSATGQSGAGTGIGVGENQYTVSLSGTDMALATDETIHVEYWVRGRGLAVTGRVVTWQIGTAATSEVQNVTLPGQGLRYLYPRSGSGALSLAVAIVKLPIKNLATALTLTGAMARQITAARAFSTAASLTASVVKLTIPLPKSVALTLAAAGRVDMGLDVLNRITSAARRVLLAVFDD